MRIWPLICYYICNCVILGVSICHSRYLEQWWPFLGDAMSSNIGGATSIMHFISAQGELIVYAITTTLISLTPIDFMPSCTANKTTSTSPPARPLASSATLSREQIWNQPSRLSFCAHGEPSDQPRSRLPWCPHLTSRPFAQ